MMILGYKSMVFIDVGKDAFQVGDFMTWENLISFGELTEKDKYRFFLQEFLIRNSQKVQR